jgi:hypothetical protein
MAGTGNGTPSNIRTRSFNLWHTFLVSSLRPVPSG